MKINRKRRIAGIMVSILLAVSTVPHLMTAAAVTRDQERWGTPSNSSSVSSASNGETALETVVFTDAAPFLPPVRVPSVSMRNLSDESGLVLGKTASQDPEKPGEYRIRLEAWATEKIMSSAGDFPVDIVLVLDQSGSMTYNFDGEYTSYITDRRQYAMKETINRFIDSVGEKYSEAGADHRMSIVTFGPEAAVLKGWTFAHEEGVDALHEAVESLEDRLTGGADAGSGMKRAENLMDGGYVYTGENRLRQKAVILLTDGIPTKKRVFDTKIASDAIGWAKNLKDQGVAVYSVGIFGGADPDELYGESWKQNWPLSDIPCTGEPESLWGGSWTDSDGQNDFPQVDVPAGNRFLNYLSSNSEDAKEIGLERGKKRPPMGLSGTGYEILKNYACENKGYYLTADNADSLDHIFTEISENICADDTISHEETVVEDMISPYFQIAEEEGISIKTAAYGGDGNFEEEEVFEQGTVDIILDEGRQKVSVEGFRFDDNYITQSPRETEEGPFHGRKLIIEFNIKPRDGFLGGNRVPVGTEESGVYDLRGDERKLVGGFGTALVNVPIPDVTVEAAPKNVYLMGQLTDEDYRAGAAVRCGGVTILGGDTGEPEEWQTAYVRVPEMPDLKVERPGEDQTDDTFYRLSCTVSPKEPEGGGAEERTGVSEYQNIQVYKPVVTLADGEIFYGEEFPEGYSQTVGGDYHRGTEDLENPGRDDGSGIENGARGNMGGNDGLSWRHGDEEKRDDTVMSGSAPYFSISFRPDSSKIKEGRVNTKSHLPMKVAAVTAEPGDGTPTKDVTAHVTFVHRDCGGETDEMEAFPGYDFLLHVKTGSLTIKNRLEEEGREDQVFVFTVKKDGVPYTSCTVLANDQTTIYELPVGSYEIQAETGKGTLAWRYGQPEYSEKTGEVTRENGDIAFTCTNRLAEEKWLSGIFQAINKLAGGGR